MKKELLEVWQEIKEVGHEIKLAILRPILNGILAILQYFKS